MNTLKKTAAGTLFGGALLVGGGLGLTQLAHAAPPAPEAQTTGDGLVDITVISNNQQIGVIQGVTLANAVSLATSVCPTAMIDLPALTNLDNNGTAPVNPCNGLMGLSFTFSQNGQLEQGQQGQNGNQGRSELAPGQNKNPAEGQPPSATPTTPPGQVGR